MEEENEFWRGEGTESGGVYMYPQKKRKKLCNILPQIHSLSFFHNDSFSLLFNNFYFHFSTHHPNPFPKPNPFFFPFQAPFPQLYVPKK